MDKICCIFNFASHYRTPIYKLMEERLDCDFYFGDSCGINLKKIDYSIFNRCIRELKFRKIIRNFNWMDGAVKLVFSNYDKYLMVGEPYCLSTWIVLILCKLLRKETFLWTHGWYGDETFIKRIIKGSFFRLATGLFLYGEYAQSLMIKEGFKKQKLNVIYNSLDYDKQLQIRAELRETDVYLRYFGNSAPVIIFIGRLEKGKRLDILLEAQKRSIQLGKLFNIIFIGEGSEKNYLEKFTEINETKKQVWFYGASYDEDKIAELIYNADLCVSPGNVGLTAIHSLSFGTPVITHNNFSNQMPEFEAIQKGITGDFFTENLADSLLETIQKWLEKYPQKDITISEGCFNVIDSKFNPYYQINLLQRVLMKK